MRILPRLTLPVLALCLALLAPAAAYAQQAAVTLYNRGKEAYEAGDYQKAETYFRTAKACVIEKSSTIYALLLYTEALSIEKQGRYAEAEQLFRQRLLVTKEIFGEKHLEYAISLNLIGQNLVHQYRLASAEKLFLRSLEILELVVGKTDINYIKVLTNMASSIDLQARFTDAEHLFREVLSLYGEINSEDNFSHTVILNNLGNNLIKQGRYAEANELLKQSLNDFKIVYGEMHANYANGLTGLGSNLLRQGLIIESDSVTRQALKIWNEVLGDNHYDYATCLNVLSENLNIQKRFAEAEQLLRRAKTIFLETGRPQDLGYAYSLNNLAWNLDAQGRYEEADTLYRQALEIRKEVLGAQHPDYAISLGNLAHNLAAQGRYAEAEPLHRQALEIAYGHYRANQQGLSEAQRQLLYETGLGPYYRWALERCAQRPGHATPAWAWGWHLNLRGLQLQTSARLQALVATSADSSLQQAFTAWRAQREYLAGIYSLTQDQLAQRRVDLSAEEARATELERALSRRSAAFAQATDTTRIAWQQVAALLQPDQGVADIARYGTDSTAGYLVFLYRHGWQGPRTLVLKNARWLETAGLNRYRRSTSQTQPDPTVYARLWAPIDSALGPVKKLYLAVDGVYNQINVNTLRRPGGGYVLDETQVVQVGSFRDLVLPPQRPQAPRAATLLGRPAYHLDSTAYEAQFVAAHTQRGGVFHLTGVTFTDLPGTEAETRAIAQLLQRQGWATTLRLGPEATEAAAKAVRQPQVLHIATHGFFLPAADKPAAGPARGLQVGGTGAGNGGSYVPDRDPLLRAGVILAGASNAAQDRRTLKEDGILTAYEAGTLNLQGTELVVLSACETGLGEVQAGEGIYGLQRSMQLAGARAVLTSLWRVDDSATQQLMTELYTRWTGGTSLRQAFAQAQAQVRAQHPQPYYWGAFVLVGD